MTTIEMIKARLDAIETYLSRTLPAMESLRFEALRENISMNYHKSNGVRTEKNEIDYKANYERLAEVEKAHRENYAILQRENMALVEENEKLKEALNKWGVSGEF